MSHFLGAFISFLFLSPSPPFSHSLPYSTSSLLSFLSFLPPIIFHFHSWQKKWRRWFIILRKFGMKRRTSEFGTLITFNFISNYTVLWRHFIFYCICIFIFLLFLLFNFYRMNLTNLWRVRIYLNIFIMKYFHLNKIFILEIICFVRYFINVTFPTDFFLI